MFVVRGLFDGRSQFQAMRYGVHFAWTHHLVGLWLSTSGKLSASEADLCLLYEKMMIDGDNDDRLSIRLRR